MSRRQKPSGQSMQAHRRVGRVARCAQIGAGGAHRQHAPAGRMDVAVRVGFGAGVEHLHIRHRRRALQAADVAAVLRRLG